MGWYSGFIGNPEIFGNPNALYGFLNFHLSDPEKRHSLVLSPAFGLAYNLNPFDKEAKTFLKNQLQGNQVGFGKIAFEDIYPLYGQIDIKGSSEARNFATKQDLTLQLNSAKFF